MRWKWFRALVLIGGAFLGSAHAASISYDRAISLQDTDWDSSITLPQFDPSLGTLTGVDFALTGHIEGSMGFEELGGGTSLVTLTFSGDIQLQRPDTTEILMASPNVQRTEANVPSFDGLLNFDGASGTTFAGLSNNDSLSTTSSAPSDLTLFTGPGNITLPVTAKGTSTGEGSANLFLDITQQASADVTVTYNYTPTPEASPLLLFTLGGGVLAWVWRKRRPQRKAP